MDKEGLGKSILTPKRQFYYGWIIVLLAFMAISTYGLFSSYSVFLESLERELQSSRATISAVFSVYLAVYCTFAPLMGWLSDRYGPRKILWLAAFLIGSGISLCSTVTSIWQLYLFFGVIASMGHGAIYVVPTSTVNRWFTRRRGLAVGIAVCGLGFGLLVVPPVANQLVSIYGWRVTFIILGSIFFVINGIVGVFIRRAPEDKGVTAQKGIEEETTAKYLSPNTEDLTVAETLRRKAFWLLYLVSAFCFGAEQMVLVHIVPYSAGIGISSAEASLGLSLLGVGTIMGRLSSGALSDKIGRVPTLVICCGIETISIFGLLAVKGTATLYLTTFLLGFGYGGWAVLGSVILGEFFGLKNLGALIGIWFTNGVPAGILGPFMGGIIFDFTRSYSWAVLIAGVLCVGSVILAALIKLPQKHPASTE